MERLETLDAKVSVNSVERLDLKDKCDAVETFEIVGKAVVGRNVKERQLISLLDVTEVIRRVTRFLGKEAQSEYRHTA